MKDNKILIIFVSFLLVVLLACFVNSVFDIPCCSEVRENNNGVVPLGYICDEDC
jgi:hypothetical protein